MNTFWRFGIKRIPKAKEINLIAKAETSDWSRLLLRQQYTTPKFVLLLIVWEKSDYVTQAFHQDLSFWGGICSRGTADSYTWKT